jgi:hypothetical protein
MSDEKKGEISPAPRTSITAGEVDDAIYDPKSEDDFEVFKKTTDGVQFRLVGWPKASVIFLKGMLCFPEPLMVELTLD